MALRGPAARSSALYEAIAPLLELATSLRAGAQAAYVIRKLHSAWARRQARSRVGS